MGNLADRMQQLLGEAKPSAGELGELQAILKKHGYDPKDAAKLAKEGMGPEELEHRIKSTKPGEKGSLEYTHNLNRIWDKKTEAVAPDLDSLKPSVAMLEGNVKKIYPLLYGAKPSPGAAAVRLAGIARDCAEILTGLGIKSASGLEAAAREAANEATGLGKKS